MNNNICAVCNNKEFKYFSQQYRKIKSKKITVHTESLYQCQKCGTLNVLPIKKSDFIDDGERYYGQMRFSKEDEDGLLEHIKFSQVPKYDYLRQEVLTKKFSKYKKWLDVGSCGYPTTFIDFDFTTIEPDRHMVALSKELFDEAKIFCSDLISFQTKEKFDAIIFNHSFYCIANPSQTIKKIDTLLNHDGIIVIGIGHIFMDAKFTSDAKILSIEDILLGETHKVYYTKESLEYLFNKFSYALIDDFFMNHNIPAYGNATKYLVFKKNKNLIKNSTEFSTLKITTILESYKHQFYAKATKNLEKFNTNDTVFIGNKELFFDVNQTFKLFNIFGFLSFNENIYDVNINNINLIQYKDLKNKKIKNIVILDLQISSEILNILENKHDVYQNIYLPIRKLSSNSLYINIGLEKYISNTFDFQVYETRYNKILKKILLQSKKGKQGIVIFGTANAAHIAYNICTILNLNIICFIDDNQTGLYKNTVIPIVTRKIFKEKFSSITGLILKGPDQNGLNMKSLYNCNIMEINHDY